MSSYLKSIKLTFRTVSPVFIGSGRSVNKREYFFNTRTGVIQFVDVDEMYKGMLKLHKENDFEQYLLGRTRDRDLYSFLKNRNIPPSVYGKWIRQTCTVGDSSLNVHRIKDIQEFCKDPQGNPYIPGSSVKGMLRTVLETVWYLKHKDQARDEIEDIREAPYADRKKYLKQNDQSLTKRAFHRAIFPDEHGKSVPEDMKNDILRGFVVGDSEPISLDNMCVCEKIDLTVDGVQKRENKVPLLRECIQPKVDFTVPITIDTRIYDLDIDRLLDSVQIFYDNYQKEFIQKFANAPKVLGNKTTLFLGGGSGYPSKTVTYGLTQGEEAHQIVSKVINATLSEESREHHGHDKDVVFGVSPHMLKCTRYHDKLYQMGACCIVKYSFRDI
jgi:CRISPR-associated protein Csm5